MEKNYVAPQIEVIEIEIEDAVLQASDSMGIGLDGLESGGGFGSY